MSQAEILINLGYCYSFDGKLMYFFKRGFPVKVLKIYPKDRHPITLEILDSE